MPEPHTPGWLPSSVWKLLALVPRLAARWPWAASITAAALIGWLGYSIAQDSGWSPAATFGLTLGGLTATLVLIASALTIYDWKVRRQAPLMILP